MLFDSRNNKKVSSTVGNNTLGKGFNPDTNPVDIDKAIKLTSGQAKDEMKGNYFRLIILLIVMSFIILALRKIKLTEDIIDELNEILAA